MKKTIIIDDQATSRLFVKKIIETEFDEINIVAEADGVQKGLDVIKKYNPDIVFLDIDMPDGTGFDLLSNLDEIDFKLIFITAHSEFAIKAIKFSAIDYILKPFDKTEIIEATKRALLKIDKEKEKVRIDTFLSNLDARKNKKIVLNTADNIYVVNVEDIIRCVSEGNYTVFYVKNRNPIMMSKILKEYEQLLSDYGFIRIHRSHLVNINHIERFVKDDSMLIMSDRSEVPVSSRKKDILIEELGKL